MKTCPQCSVSFEITPEDLQFYDNIAPVFGGRKYPIPEPILCPSCRMQRRMMWRNERKLYRRSCGLCGKSMLAMYAPEVAFPVYCSNCWWSDKWNPLDYGRDFDFSESFFEQFDELQQVVPHFSLAVLRDTMENSDFCNHAGWLKNCYLLVNSDESEQCLYGKGVNRCFDCVDCFKVYDCQACYEASNCTNCSFCTFLLDSHNSNDCHFCASLIGCKNCFGCVNLRNKEYYFFNEKLGKEKYERRVSELHRIKSMQDIRADFLDFQKNHPLKWMQEKNTENSTGDYLVQTKNCFHCFDSEYLENSKYCSDLKKGGKISFGNQDITYFGMGVDNSYDCSVVGYNVNHVLFCENVWESYDVSYSQICPQGCNNLFGCIGLRHKAYCILNKQYSREEYEELVPKIIEHMEKTPLDLPFARGEVMEWGQFFPVSLSPFGYNEVTAQEYFPHTKKEVLAKGWKWYDEKEPDFSDVTKKIPAAKLPNSIENIPNDVLNWAIECTESKRLFRIQKGELDFYRRMNLPLPHFHPDIRHARRFALRTPRKLWQRKCSNCGKGIETTYSSERHTQVYCEKCYLQAVE